MKTLNKNLPHSFEAEKTVISKILYNSKLAEVLFEKLKVGDFFSLVNQQIYNALLVLYTNNIEIDIVSILEEVKKAGGNATVVRKVLTESMDDVGAGNIEYHCKTIKNKSNLRKLAIILEQGADLVYDEAIDFKKLVVDLEGRLLNISETKEETRPTDPVNILKEVNADINQAEKYGWRGFPTGFLQLDNRVAGLIPTHVWIVGAPTGTGKTFFILQLILNLLQIGTKMMLFSTEMDRKMTMLRLLGNLANLSPLNMLKGGLDDDAQTRKHHAERVMTKANDNLVIYDSIYSMDEIRLKIKKQKLKQGVDVVFIDYIQNLRAKGTSSIYERMSQAALDLQKLAHELEVCIVIASQVNQAGADLKENTETISYKGAGEIAAIADVGLWLKRHKGIERDQRYLLIRKARHGIPGKILVDLQFPSGRMCEAGGGVENTLQSTPKVVVEEEIPELKPMKLGDGTDGIVF